MTFAKSAALAAIVAAGALAPSRADAYVLKHGQTGALVSWRKDAITFALHREVEELSGTRDATDDALAAWSRQSGAPDMSLASNDAPASPAFDGVNGVFMGDAPGKALAITVLTFDDSTGAILDADVIIDEDHRFSADDTEIEDADQGEPVYDIRKVVAHEMGHALGLADEPAHGDALMFPVIRKKEGRSTPGSDDLAGIGVLYETSPRTANTLAAPLGDDGSADASGSQGCAITHAAPAGAASSRSFVALVALGALSLGRRSLRRARPAQRT